MSFKPKHTILHYLLSFGFVLFKSILSSLFWLLLFGVGYIIFQLKKSPYDLAIGMPLLLVSGGLIFNSLLSVFYVLFSKKYNSGVCPICTRSQTD